MTQAAGETYVGEILQGDPPAWANDAIPGGCRLRNPPLAWVYKLSCNTFCWTTTNERYGEAATLDDAKTAAETALGRSEK